MSSVHLNDLGIKRNKRLKEDILETFKIFDHMEQPKSLFSTIKEVSRMGNKCQIDLCNSYSHPYEHAIELATNKDYFEKNCNG